MEMRRSSGHADPLHMTSAFLVATTVVGARSDPRLSRRAKPVRRAAVADVYVIEPAAPGLAGRTVEPGHIRLDVQDRRPLDEVDPAESDNQPGNLGQPDEAESDRVDSPRSARREYAHLPLLRPEQER